MAVKAVMVLLGSQACNASVSHDDLSDDTMICSIVGFNNGLQINSDRLILVNFSLERA